MINQPSSVGPLRSFRDRFCDRHCAGVSCTEEEFEHRVFLHCLHPRARGLIRVVWAVDRDLFDEDFELIRELARTASFDEFRSELKSFRADHPPRGFLRNKMKVRISGRALLAVASQLFGRAQSVEDEMASDLTES